MTWICPECKRNFKNTNQSHSCVTINIETLFAGKQQIVYELFQTLKYEVKQFGEINISATLSSVMFSAKGTFLAIKPKQKYLDIEFVLDYPTHEFPIIKNVQISKKGYAHFIRLENLQDIDHQLLQWLKQAYSFYLEIKT